MLSQIKIYIGIAVSAIIAILAGLVKYQSKRADNAEEKAEKAEVKADFAEERIERHEDKKQIEESVNNASESDVDDRLSKYYRD